MMTIVIDFGMSIKYEEHTVLARPGYRSNFYLLDSILDPLLEIITYAQQTVAIESYVSYSQEIVK
jgi:hypothetical protein